MPSVGAIDQSDISVSLSVLLSLTTVIEGYSPFPGHFA